MKAICLIPNGVTTDIPVDELPLQIARDRREVRVELELPENALLIGSLTRDVKEKDIPTMLEAFALLYFEDKRVFLILAGEGMSDDNEKIIDLLVSMGIRERVLLLGMRNDPRRLIRAFDIATLSSCSEAFPLFIAEAMSLGIPCVSTDVGDIALLLGGHGRLVPVASPRELMRAWHEVLNLRGSERWELVNAARKRVEAEFSVQQVVGRHARIYDELLK